jgi:murein DD-endopeptidase MepM/ murein hydrolase activator NlpD
MSGIRRAATLAAIAALAYAVPSRAAAEGTWVRPVDGAVALAYGARWTDAAGRSCSHGGLDLLTAAGASVKACGPGEVVFAGLVPAGEGARAYAVTVLTSDGLRVTYLPLTSIGVSKGQAVSAGGPIGSVAASGDGSSAQTHLHLGVKRGDAALDPAGFLAPVENMLPAEPPAPAHGTPEVHAVPRPAPRVAPSPTHQNEVVPQPSPGSAALPAPSAAQAARGAVQAAASALSLVEPIARVEPVSTPAVLDVERAGADLAAGRESLLSVVLRVGLVLLAGACVIPVLHAAGRSAASPKPKPAPATLRRDRS